MSIERFEDIIAWKKTNDLTLFVYKCFKTCKDYGFKDQIQRAAISIMNNIAEGFERKGDKEFKQFLFIAKGSCGELRSMLYVAIELGYISKNNYQFLYNTSLEISKILSGFIKKL
jgi:four helix bundle protein